MKKRNVIALAGVALLSAGILAACSGGSKSSSSSNGQKFSYVYETEPENLNYITSGKAATHEITGNLIDGLFEMTSTEIWSLLLQKIGQFLKMV